MLVVSQDTPLRKAIARSLTCSGVAAVERDDAESAREHALASSIPGLAIVDAAQFDRAVRGNWNHWWLICVTREQDPRWFEVAVEHDIVCGIVGASEDLPFPTRQLVSVGRRLVLRRAPPPSAPLAWGHLWHERSVGDNDARRERIDEVHRFAEDVCGGRMAGKAADVTDELLMNAMYDAPVDGSGTPLYAHDRKSPVQLEPEQRPVLGYGADGDVMVLTVGDPFGRLRRRSVFESMHRGLTTGQMDTSGGGAGLGMSIIYRNCSSVFFDVQRREHTQVSVMMDLVRKPRRGDLPRSVLFFEYPSRRPKQP